LKLNELLNKNKNIMENFFIEDNFFSDLESLIDHYDWDENDVAALPDDWSIKVGETSPEKIFEFDMETIVDAIVEITDRWEERFPEDSDNTFEKIKAAIKQGVDLEKINAALPQLWYLNGKELIITKADLVEHCK
jgi:hypothetical protein